MSSMAARSPSTRPGRAGSHLDGTEVTTPSGLRGRSSRHLRNAEFRVELDSGLEVIARASGKMRRGRGIRIIAGDKVEVEVSAYDPTKGRIVWRHR